MHLIPHLDKHVSLLHQHLFCCCWLTDKRHALPSQQQTNHLAMLPPQPHYEIKGAPKHAH
jgi:hypothetical protein